VELRVLGASGTWPPAGGETCGYLVSHDGFHIWLDAGTGTFARLQEHIDVADLGGIVISHGHPDHFVDIIPAFYARHYYDMGSPDLPFYSPPGFTDLAALLVSENGRNVMAECYSFITASDRSTFELGPFTITPYAMEHIGVDALGFRIEADGGVLAYTGDTGPCDAAVELSREADVLLAEASYHNDSHILPFHLSAAQAGEIATAASAKRLVLTHIPPPLDPAISRAEASATFAGPVDLAVTGLRVEVGE
jgi:ribonuclease BN (tRNA processing enzyme)